MINVSENVNKFLDRNLGSEITEPSQISNEIEVISQRLAGRNNTKMTQVEDHLNSKFGEILEEIRVTRSSYTISDEEDAANNRSGPSNSENKTLRKKQGSYTPIDKDKNENDCFQPSKTSELRQLYARLGVVN